MMYKWLTTLGYWSLIFWMAMLIIGIMLALPFIAAVFDWFFTFLDWYAPLVYNALKP